jgi:hypothetical protein
MIRTIPRMTRIPPSEIPPNLRSAIRGSPFSSSGSPEWRHRMPIRVRAATSAREVRMSDGLRPLHPRKGRSQPAALHRRRDAHIRAYMRPCDRSVLTEMSLPEGRVLTGHDRWAGLAGRWVVASRHIDTLADSTIARVETASPWFRNFLIDSLPRPWRKEGVDIVTNRRLVPALILLLAACDPGRRRTGASRLSR